MSSYDAIVLLGFGGPESREEIRPFLDRVLEGRRIPPARYEEVAGHYEHMPGGKSPFNELTRRQAAGLERELRARGITIPLRIAYKNSAPYERDVVEELARAGAHRLLGVILAVHQSPASWDKYRTLPNADYVEPYFDHPLFVRANAERVRDALARLGKTTFDGVALIFTAHSIPQAMADRSPYVRQLERSAELIAKEAGAPAWRIAYQSRSGSPADPWLEPDVRDVLKSLPASGIHDAIVAPVGFLCDHVEVLYDLDVDAAASAREAGVHMERAQALNDHPLFVRMLAELVERCAG
jgi:ferrochelatase